MCSRSHTPSRKSIVGRTPAAKDKCEGQEGGEREKARARLGHVERIGRRASNDKSEEKRREEAPRTPAWHKSDIATGLLVGDSPPRRGESFRCMTRYLLLLAEVLLFCTHLDDSRYIVFIH